VKTRDRTKTANLPLIVDLEPDRILRGRRA
jgi:hypothetical protein